MRVLISAFSCSPDRGSEPEVGLQTVLSAASEHDVWVLTRRDNVADIQRFLSGHPTEARIRLIGLEEDGIPVWLKGRSGFTARFWYYSAWQRRAAVEACRLDSNVNFDVVHHATFGAYWSRPGVAAVDKPFVWGPIGGATNAPLMLAPAMGLIGAAGDLVRTIARPIAATWTSARRTARRAAVVLVNNPETARKLGPNRNQITLPQGLVAAQLSSRVRSIPRHNTPPRIVTAGRLLGWKATWLALVALPHLDHSDACLHVYGGGPQRRRLERLAARLRIESRVSFHGRIDRQLLLEAVASASALVHPALHEASGLVVAEALMLGTPVVALDRGGPPIPARYWPHVPSRFVETSTPRATARDIAKALDEVMGQRGSIDPSPGIQFTEGILYAYEFAVGMTSL